MPSMHLIGVPHEENIFMIQKLYLSKWSSHCHNDINNISECGRLALVQTSNASFCICKVFCHREIHPSYVYLDASVVHLPNCEGDSLPNRPINVSDVCDVDNIQLLPQLSFIKNLSLTVIFDEVSSLQKWKAKREKLSEIVLEILKLFVITSKCVVFFKNLTESLRHGIHALVVHSSSHSKGGTAPGQVTSHTTIETLQVASKLRFLQLQGNAFTPKLGGLDDAKNTLSDILKTIYQHKNCANLMSLKPTKQVLVTGPPGCGKSSVVKQVAAEFNATLLTIFGPEVISSKPGVSEETLRKVFENASILADEAVCILLLDEVDSLCPRRDLHRASSHSIRTTVQLLALLEKVNSIPGLVIIATTNKPFILDPSVRRPGRLEKEVHVGVPTEADRASILHLLLKSVNSPDLIILAKYVASLTPGYVGADLALLCQEASRFHHRRISNTSEDFTEGNCVDGWKIDFQKSVAKIKPSVLRGGLGVVLTHPIPMDAIGGLENIKKELRVAVQWPLIHPDAFARMGLPRPKGILLYGPPGCAKTSLARAVATETNTTFLAVSAADLYSPFVGEAERNIMGLFRRARASAPTILFIDEIDALVGSRGDFEGGANEQVLSTFLTEMDGVGLRLDDTSFPVGMTSQPCEKTPEKINWTADVIVVAATNRPDKLDDAILRPGRLDKLLYVPAPNLQERFAILKCISAQMPLADCVDLSYIAEHTNFYSGADLSQLSKEAALHALTEDGMKTDQVKQCHFVAALNNYRPSLTEQQLSWYKNYVNRKSTLPECLLSLSSN